MIQAAARDVTIKFTGLRHAAETDAVDIHRILAVVSTFYSCPGTRDPMFTLPNRVDLPDRFHWADALRVRFCLTRRHHSD